MISNALHNLSNSLSSDISSNLHCLRKREVKAQNKAFCSSICPVNFPSILSSSNLSALIKRCKRSSQSRPERVARDIQVIRQPFLVR